MLSPTICGNKRIYFPKHTLCDECEPEPIMMPEYIRIIVSPDKLEYTEDESIILEGIEVRAYYGDSTEWGIVPLDEQTHEPQTAGGATPGFYKGFKVYTGSRSPIEFTDEEADEYLERLPDGTGVAITHNIKFQLYWQNQRYTNLVTGVEEHNSASHAFESDSKVWVFIGYEGSGRVLHLKASTPSHHSGYAGGLDAAATARLLAGLYDINEVIVSWDRGDGVILSDSYNITVY